MTIHQRWPIRHCGITEAQHSVIQTPEAWAAFWSAAHRLQLPTPPAPEVDFSRSMVLAVSQDQRSSGGWTLQIQGVRREPEALVAEVHETTPPEGSMTTMALASACEAVLIDASSLPVRFDRQ